MTHKNENNIEVVKVSKSFQVGSQNVSVLKDVSLSVESGDFLIIFGPSGCGKSTLLPCLLGLEPPTSGSIQFFGEDLYAAGTEDDRAIARKQMIGMVYQQSDWIKSLDVKGNVAFPLRLLGIEENEALEAARKVLDRIGVLDWADYIPTELSSGQQQRVSLARAIIHNPEVIVADEPTGNLDFESGKRIMEILSDMNMKRGQTVIMVTHDLEYLRYAKHVAHMFDGRVIRVYDDTDKEEIFSEMRVKSGMFSGRE